MVSGNEKGVMDKKKNAKSAQQITRSTDEKILQPFSVVDNKCLRRLVSTLEPKYKYIFLSLRTERSCWQFDKLNHRQHHLPVWFELRQLSSHSCKRLL